MPRMRAVLVLTSLVLTVLALTLTVRPGVTHADTAPPQLNDHMEAIGDAMGSLRRSVRDPEQDASTLELITKMQTHVLAAKQMVPTKLAELPEAERTALVKKYRASMSDLLAEMCVAERLVLEGRNADAFESVKKLNSMKMQGHEAFKVE